LVSDSNQQLLFTFLAFFRRAKYLDAWCRLLEFAIVAIQVLCVSQVPGCAHGITENFVGRWNSVRSGQVIHQLSYEVRLGRELFYLRGVLGIVRRRIFLFGVSLR